MYQIHCYTPTRTTERIIVTTADDAEKAKSRLAKSLLRQDKGKEPEPVFAVIVHTMRISGRRSRLECPGSRVSVGAPASAAAAATEELVDDPFAEIASPLSANLAGSVFQPVPEGTKYCFQCDRILSLDNFGRDCTKKDQKCTRCRSCISRMDKARYARRRAAMSAADIANNSVPIPGAMKRCQCCDEEKPLDAFHKSFHRQDGRDRLCRTCVAEQGRIRYAKRKAERAAAAC